MTARRGVARDGECVRPRHIAHVDEVAELAPVLEDGRRAAGGEGALEDAGHTGVWRVPRHPRAVDVVVTERDQLDPRLPCERRTQVLLMDLRRRVDAAWIDRRFLADGERHEVAFAFGTHRIERTGLETLSFSRKRSHV